MAANTRLATAVQILCVVLLRDVTTAEAISRSLRTNPVVVRRLLKALQRDGLVALKPGKDGGVRLLLHPSEITLERICRAVEPNPAPFALRPPGNPNCAVDRSLPNLLRPVLGQAEAAMLHTLRQVTLQSLAAGLDQPLPPSNP